MPAHRAGKILVMKNKKFRNDIILIAAVLLAAAILALLFFVLRKEGAYVSVVQNGKETARYSLSENVTVILENGGTNVLIIENGYVFVSDASCPDKICFRHRKIRFAGEAITCLPNKTVIKIVSGEGVDAVS